MSRRIRIEDVRVLRWAGTHFSDGRAFDICHEVAVDASRPVAERLEALQIMSTRGMGEDAILTEKDLENYVEETRTPDTKRGSK